MPTPPNLLHPLPSPRPDEPETFTAVLQRPGVTIERIVSRGHVSPPDFWYEQTGGEWVVLLQGAARLRFADETEARELGPGDHIDIAPGRRHRVEWTDPVHATVWLAVHYPADPGPL